MFTEVMELVAADNMTKDWWQMMGGKLNLGSVTKEKTKHLWISTSTLAPALHGDTSLMSCTAVGRWMQRGKQSHSIVNMASYKETNSFGTLLHNYYLQCY